MNFIIVMSRMHCKVNGSKFATVYLIDDWKCLENVSRCQIGNESDSKIVININTLFFHTFLQLHVKDRVKLRIYGIFPYVKNLVWCKKRIYVQTLYNV